MEKEEEKKGTDEGQGNGCTAVEQQGLTNMETLIPENYRIS